MTGKQKILIALVATVAAVAALPAAASAAIYDVRVSIAEAGTYSPTKQVYVEAYGLNPAQNTRLVVRRPGVALPVEDQTEFSGSDYFSTYTLELIQPGDSLEIYQPSGAVTPATTYVVPTMSMALSGTTINGAIGPGVLNTFRAYETCLDDGKEAALSPAGGAFAQELGALATPGRVFRLENRDSRGFETQYTFRAAGERPCVQAQGSRGNFELDVPGRTSQDGYSVYADDLSPTIPDLRLVVRRGGTAVADASVTSYSSGGITSPVPVLPGDVIELYRPKTAPTPTFVYSVPQISGVFDTGNDLAAITGPAMRSAFVSACEPILCLGSTRYSIDTPAGRTFYNFAQPQSERPAIDLTGATRIVAGVQLADQPLFYSFDATPGDLAAPTIKASPAKRYKLATLKKALKKGLKIKLSTTEPGTASMKLTIPAKLPTRKQPKPKQGKKTLTLASGTVGVAAGNSSVKLKFSKSGKKAVGALIKVGKKLPKLKALLTTSVTDASGNAQTVTKTVTLSR